MKIGKNDYDLNRNFLIMGILNVTPDSFSDGGKYTLIDSSLKQVEKMMAEGADLIDIGGESTRPGHLPVSGQEEIKRVIPVIEAIKSHFDIPLSIDSSKAEVAKAALDAGANMVNDIWGFKKEPELADLVAHYQVPCVLMHNRFDRNYYNFFADFLEDLQLSIDLALAAGVSRDLIILDPGIGFVKNHQQNLYVMNHLQALHDLGFPLLLGTSRKQMIGKALDLPVDQRVEGTMATTVIGIMKGVAIFRVHDVQGNKRAALMAQTILRG